MSYEMIQEKMGYSVVLPKLKPVYRALLRCNGDCGSKLSQFFDHCIKYKVELYNDL